MAEATQAREDNQDVVAGAAAPALYWVSQSPAVG
jgi:hypothetical protein